MATHSEHPAPVDSMKDNPRSAKQAEAVKQETIEPAAEYNSPDEGVSIDEMNAAISRHGADAAKYMKL